MDAKLGAYLNLHGKVYDINADYLYDPKISTFVDIPLGGNITIISPDFIKRVYVVTDNYIDVVYGGDTISPLHESEIAPDLILSVFRLSGKEFSMTIVPRDGNETRVYFVTSVGMDISRNFYVNPNKKYIPKETSFDIILEPGVPAGSEFYSTVVPDEGFVFDIKYFKVSTPANAVANIILKTANGEQAILAENQPENLYQVYDYSDFEDGAFTQVYAVYGYVKVTGQIFGEERVKFSMSGVQESM